MAGSPLQIGKPAPLLRVEVRRDRVVHGSRAPAPHFHLPRPDLRAKNAAMAGAKMGRSEAENLYDRLIAAHPNIERKGVNNPYTSLNGNMFTFLSKEGEVALRLPEAVRQEIISTHGGWQTISYGAVMKEYVSIPPALLRQTQKLRPFLEQSLEFARTLKAKPTTRGKPPARKTPSRKKPVSKKSVRKTARRTGAQQTFKKK